MTTVAARSLYPMLKRGHQKCPVDTDGTESAPPPDQRPLTELEALGLDWRVRVSGTQAVVLSLRAREGVQERGGKINKNWGLAWL